MSHRNSLKSRLPLESRSDSVMRGCRSCAFVLKPMYRRMSESTETSTSRLPRMSK